jgi:hypothetical protein
MPGGHRGWRPQGLVCSGPPATPPQINYQPAEANIAPPALALAGLANIEHGLFATILPWRPRPEESTVPGQGDEEKFEDDEPPIVSSRMLSS